MGRASRAIGGSGKSSSASGRRTGDRVSGGTAYSPLAAPGRGPASLLSRVFGGADGLDALLQPALGPAAESWLAASGSGPTNLLSQLLGVPDNLDSLVRAAMDGAREPQNASTEADPVESVLYTIRSDDSNPAEPRIAVEAEVIQDPAFEGQPSLHVRFVGVTETGARQALGYRPSWTPVLVRTPEDLAEQMRVRWRDAVEELQAGADPRMATFLAGCPGMESARAVLNSSQSSASKFVLLQGLMDPDGIIQFQGFGLNAATFAEQIRGASEGDEDALTWLEDVQREDVLTSLAEVTGSALAAEADFRLSLWHQQGMELIEAVTIRAEESDFDFSMIRSLLTMRAETNARREELRAQIAETRASSSDDVTDRAFTSILDSLDSVSPSDLSADHGLLEDWYFEETRAYLQARFRQALPGLFAVALTPVAADGSGHAALAAEVRRMAEEASTDPKDYSSGSDASRDVGLFAGLYGRPSRREPNLVRIERIIQAVRRVVAEFAAVGEDDLGTLVIVQEVLAYAQWKRDELRGGQQVREAERHKAAADERASEAKHRADAAKHRADEALKSRSVAEGVDQSVQKYVEALARTTGSIEIQDPLPESSQSAAVVRLEQATAREKAAGEWKVAAEERERWAATETPVAATPAVEERLGTEREAALAEQSQAEAELQAARDDQQAARDDLAVIAAGRAKFEELTRDVRDENARRLQDEAERRHQREAQLAEERRQKADEQRKKQEAERARQEAANARQEELNERQSDRARAAKEAIAAELARLLALPSSASFWRRRALAATRASLEQAILDLQQEIAPPLVPPRTRSQVWPNMLSRGEKYLGIVKKVADYGAFVSLPAGADGLVRSSSAMSTFAAGQLVIVEVADMPYGKPIVLKRIEG